MSGGRRGLAQQAAIRLGSLMPTEAELEAARAVINAAQDPAKKLRSAMGSFTHWLNTCGGAALNPEAVAAQGDQRQQFLYDFLVFQAREKKSKLEQKVVRSATASKTGQGVSGWISWEELKREIGEEKADLWVESKLITTRPDSRSGKSSKTLDEYFYTKVTQMDRITKEGTATVEHTDDANEESVTKFPDIMDISVLGPHMPSLPSLPSSSSVPPVVPDQAANPAPRPSSSMLAPPQGATPRLSLVVVKQEPAPVDLEQQAINEFIKNAKVHLQHHQSMVTNLKVMSNKLESVEFTESIRAAIEKLTPKVTRTAKILEGLATKKPEDVVASEVPKVMKAVRLNKESYDGFLTAAKRFGVNVGGGGERGGSATRRKRKATPDQ